MSPKFLLFRVSMQGCNVFLWRSLHCPKGQCSGPTPPENVFLLKRKTILNNLNFPRIWSKLCQNEAQDHSSLGAKDEPCSYDSVLKRAV